MKIKIDQVNCIGCGLCAMTYPEIFVFTEEGKAGCVKPEAELKCDEPVCNSEAELLAVNEEQAKEVVNVCPIGVITIE